MYTFNVCTYTYKCPYKVVAVKICYVKTHSSTKSLKIEGQSDDSSGLKKARLPISNFMKPELNIEEPADSPQQPLLFLQFKIEEEKLIDPYI